MMNGTCSGTHIIYQVASALAPIRISTWIFLNTHIRNVSGDVHNVSDVANVRRRS
jgi:hypothetical protein